jgi:hypothetical protein
VDMCARCALSCICIVQHAHTEAFPHYSLRCLPHHITSFIRDYCRYQSPDKADPTYGGDLEMQQHGIASQPSRSERTSMTTFNRQFTGKHVAFC